MNMRKFILEIELENDAMQTPRDVAQVLRRIARRLDRDMQRWFVDDACSIRDENGNAVGKWVTTEDCPDRQRESD